MKKTVLAMMVLAVMAAGCGKTEKAAPATTAEEGKAVKAPQADAGQPKAPTLSKPKVFLDLPEEVNGPDGMTLGPDGTLYVAAPNFVDTNYPGLIIAVDKDNKWEVFCKAPIHPETGRGCPMGMDFGPDGNLYYADNQYFSDKNYKSRLMRVVIEDGKAKNIEVAVDGFKLSNAVIWKGNDLFVSDTFFDVEDTPGLSGIFRFTLDELNKGTVKLQPSHKDPHIIATFITVPNRGDVAGADGMTIDSKGNLYTGNFGDGVMSKITFNEDGSVKSQEIISKEITCCDGIFCDLTTDDIYITDSRYNAIHVMRPDGTMFKDVWKNGASDGSDGLLDQPCEPIIRGDELIVVNFDFASPEWGLINKEPDDKHNISVFTITR
ncbi:MAG: SMP-30/gluconolactonase/LRE family protein [Kiritimatiellae bacterium]|nr:SMP-30/gluconolactonase/LRE family protein [Kiritimatiellia bacterium]